MQGGLIVNIGSVAAIDGKGPLVAYGTTKHAIRGWSLYCKQVLCMAWHGSHSMPLVDISVPPLSGMACSSVSMCWHASIGCCLLWCPCALFNVTAVNICLFGYVPQVQCQAEMHKYTYCMPDALCSHTIVQKVLAALKMLLCLLRRLCTCSAASEQGQH